MRIAIGVPDELDGQRWNGFRKAFGDMRQALSAHELRIFAPSGGDVRLGAGHPSRSGLIAQYDNTIALSRDFAVKVPGFRPDRIIAFNSMGLFLKEPFIYYSSNVPYRKVLEIAQGEYPPTPHFRELLEYYRFVAEREAENYEKAERIIVLSDKIRRLLVGYGVSGNKITYIPRPIPAIDKALRAPGRGRMKIIFMPAELRVMKGIRYAIETMKLLKERLPDAVLVICGRINNYERGYVQSLLGESKGKANIILAGFPAREKYLRYMADADCAFLPFCFDECPISLSECIGSGLPVVTNEFAGYPPERISRFGFLARHNDAHDCAQALYRLLTDDGARAEKAAGAREAAADFTFARYKEALSNVVEGP